MRHTVKREPVKFDLKVENYSRHFNQMTFKGIVHNKNLFEVDQQSLNNTKNIYIDENLTLVSRLPIMSEKLPIGYIEENATTILTPIVPENYQLIDMFETGKVTVYISQNENTNLYRIVARLNHNHLLQIISNEVANYHINAIEHYIIVFNNVDAMVLDVTQFNKGWKFLRELAEIPITKRIINQQVFTKPINQFTKSYKEEYLWDKSILSILPNGNAEVIVNQSPNKLTWLLEEANLNTEFRILRSLGIKTNPQDLFSIAINVNTGITVIAIARQDHVMLSLDDGQSFEKVLYPINNGFLNIASLSKDALCFFFVAQDGVYRYDISNKIWTDIRITTLGKSTDLKGRGFYNTCCFNNAEVFSFVLYETGEVEGNPVPITYLYGKGPGLKLDDFDENTLSYKDFINKSNPEHQLNKTRQDLANVSIFIEVTENHANISAWLPSNSANSSLFINVFSQEETSVITRTIDKPYGAIYSIKEVNADTIIIEGLTVEDSLWYKIEATISEDEDNFKYTSKAISEIKVNNEGAPINLQTGYLIDLNVVSVDGETRLPKILDDKEWPTSIRGFTISNNNNYYIQIGDTIFTNKILMSNNASIIYTRIDNTPYTKIPDVSYVNNELYLSFNNTLKITSNYRKGTNLMFNLPEINNHGFTSDVNDILNISTTEVAIFLVDRIFLVVQEPDELLGYRYSYYNTRLSNGVRKNEQVINTRDGVYTLYPTIEGLAVLNYQAFIATTDQVVEYVTKDITDIWINFYKKSTSISLLQMKDYIFVTNKTNEYLMLDLRNMTWWQFESPIPIVKLSTDQFSLKIISNGLYKFDKDYIVYKDFSTKHINWQLESQPLHFTLPNHYKNIRQIIFQFEEATNKEQTILAQVKLYRKQISYKEPEIIKFKVDGYKTFVKRFNYWKVNELQWALAADLDTVTPAQLRINGLTVKFEPGEEVRS